MTRHVYEGIKRVLKLHEFYESIQQRLKAYPQERYCQAAFNALAEVRPDLSESVRGKDNDPFYCTSLDEPRWKRFVEFLNANW